MKLKNITPMARAIESLFFPYVEIVLHDLTKNKIATIFNNFSKRNIGDDSLLDAAELEAIHEGSSDVIGPYEKINWDGRRLKSVSVILRNEDSKQIGLLCINLDVSHIQECHQMLDLFLNPKSLISQPASLFKEDWQERINKYVHATLRKRGKTLKSLSRADKRELVQQLERKGAFKGKNTASYIGKLLGISRATVYNCISHVGA